MVSEITWSLTLSSLLKLTSDLNRLVYITSDEKIVLFSLLFSYINFAKTFISLLRLQEC